MMIVDPAKAKHLYKPMPWRLRFRWYNHRLTWFLRGHPTFFIIGTMKGGTTSLYNYLVQHPQILKPFRKEIKFFGSNYPKGFVWYQAHFPFRYKLERANGISGEATAYYMFHPTALERLAAQYPNAKILILLRNPIERAFSHYQHMVRVGREPLSFEDALNSEPERLLGEAEKIAVDPFYPQFKHIQYSYVARGEYITQLERVFATFPKEQVKILRSKDMYANPSDIFLEVQKFLELESWEPNSYGVYKEGGYSAAISTETRKKLASHFKPFNDQLYSYLGRDFHWK